jgi:NAD+ kinase
MNMEHEPRYAADRPIAIACRLDTEQSVLITEKIINYLTSKNVKIVLETRIAQRFHQFIPKKDLRDMSEDSVKLLISVGGDGTILRVAQNLPRKNPTPILGINLGSVGFLDESEADDKALFSTLDKIINDDYTVERSMRITGIYNHIRLADALNELYIVSAKPSKVLHVGIKVDNEFLSTGYMDGVIISTSVGSTAYCLSAGGSLVDPRLRVIQIVPVNPFARAGSLKPIVLPSTSEVEIQLLRPKLNALIIIDGQQEYKAFPKTSIRIRKSESDIKFVRLNKNFHEGFYNKLRSKLLMGITLPAEDSPEE